ncbi:hypothetical protein CA831_02625 [Burkholderia multivorans]|nr:hypothetical protein CA831_02625 [Burkholderia multivorans]
MVIVVLPVFLYVIWPARSVHPVGLPLNFLLQFLAVIQTVLEVHRADVLFIGLQDRASLC